jgi:autotransporter passenger strand-loop-strand repeat protein
VAIGTVVDSGLLWALSGGTASSAIVNSGGWELVDGGHAIGTAVSAGGVVVVETGGTAGSAVVNSGGTGVVSSGGTASGTLLDGGDLWVYAGATASSAIVNSGGRELVDGGHGIGTTVNAGGSLWALFAGTADSAVVNSGGTEFVFSAGSTDADTVMSGGVLEVRSGATVSGATLSGDATVDFLDVVYTASATASVNSTTDLLTLDNHNGQTQSIGVNPAEDFSGTTFIITPGGQGGTDVTIQPCFRSGTLITTQRGEVAVEDLRVGDRAASAFGGTVAVRWLGYRSIDCRRHPKPHDVWPVHIAPGAFGADQPRRDLWLSPDHAVFVDGVLIPVRYLLNDATIRQEAADEVTYWHVELPLHDVLFAEGLPAESYLDTGNRGAFANGGGVVMLHPDFALRVWEAQACAPLVVEGAGAVAARSVLLDRAEALGHSLTDEPDLRLVVGGRSVRGTVFAGVHRFRLPRGVTVARLLTRSAVPAFVRADSDDHRRLGVAVSRMTLDGREITLTDARLGKGWYGVENGWRWTDGDAAIAVAKARVLEIGLAMTARYRRTEQPPAAIAV